MAEAEIDIGGCGGGQQRGTTEEADLPAGCKDFGAMWWRWSGSDTGQWSSADGMRLFRGLRSGLSMLRRRPVEGADRDPRTMREGFGVMWHRWSWSAACRALPME